MWFYRFKFFLKNTLFLFLMLPLFPLVSQQFFLSKIETQEQIDWKYYQLFLRASFPASQQVNIQQKNSFRLQVREEILSKASLSLEKIYFDCSFTIAELLEENSYFAEQYSFFLEALNNGTLVSRGNKVMSDMLILLRGENSLLQHLPVAWKTLEYKVNSEKNQNQAYQPSSSVAEYTQDNFPDYSGLVIDAREFKNLNPALLPRIYNQDGFLIYGPEYLSQSIGIERGIIGYVKSYNDPEVLHRAGINHYFTVPLSVKGKYKSDIVISNHDAQRILTKLESITNLRKARVIVILP